MDRLRIIFFKIISAIWGVLFFVCFLYLIDNKHFNSIMTVGKSDLLISSWGSIVVCGVNNQDHSIVRFLCCYLLLLVNDSILLLST